MVKRLVVHGRVQGVFFRDSVRRKADARGVSGWVANRSDGTVEAVLSGADDDVAALVEFCRTGPSGASVTDVEVYDDADEPVSGFQIR